MVAAILKRPLPLGRRSYCDKNEILCVGIEADLTVILVLMADWWIRQIEVFPAEGAWIDRGQVLAHIRMGSQVDVWVPSESVIFRRSPCDAVVAGETILATKISGLVAFPRSRGHGKGEGNGVTGDSPLYARR